MSQFGAVVICVSSRPTLLKGFYTEIYCSCCARIMLNNFFHREEIYSDRDRERKFRWVFFLCTTSSNMNIRANSPSHRPNGIPIFQVTYALYSCITSLWCSVFLANWRRHESFLRLRWFGITQGTEKDIGYMEPIRSRFHGRAIRSPVTGEAGDIFFSNSVRLVRQLCSWIMVCVLLTVSIILVLMIGKLRTVLVANAGNDHIVKVIQIVTGWMNSIQINVFNQLGDRLARRLNDWENYPSRRRFCNALILKLFVFRFVNCFNVFFYIAFFKDGIEGCVKGGTVVRGGCK